MYVGANQVDIEMAGANVRALRKRPKSQHPKELLVTLDKMAARAQRKKKDQVRYQRRSWRLRRGWWHEVGEITAPGFGGC